MGGYCDVHEDEDEDEDEDEEELGILVVGCAAHVLRIQ